MSDDKMTATAESTKEPKRGVGTVAREAIRAGKTNEEALAAVVAEFPDSKTTLPTMSWYRNALRKEDPSIPSGRAAKKAGEPAAEKTADPLA